MILILPQRSLKRSKMATLHSGCYWCDDKPCICDWGTESLPRDFSTFNSIVNHKGALSDSGVGLRSVNWCFTYELGQCYTPTSPSCGGMVTIGGEPHLDHFTFSPKSCFDNILPKLMVDQLKYGMYINGSEWRHGSKPKSFCTLNLTLTLTFTIILTLTNPNPNLKSAGCASAF